MNDRLSLINSQIEEQQRILDELNHKVMLKENQLGITKIKELMSKLETAEKQIKDLSKNISEKKKIIEKLQEDIKKLKLIKPKFENLSIENNINKIEIIGLLTYKNLDESINSKSNINIELDMKEENKLLKGKIIRMKNSINDLSTKLEKELLIKEQKNLQINESNSKLFEDLQKINKDLAFRLKQENINIMSLKKEKYDLETICIKQEECIRSLKKKININNNKKNLKQNAFSKSNILPHNIKIGNQTEGDIKINNQNQNNNFRHHSGFLPLIK